MGISLVNNKGVKSFQNADYSTYYAVAEIIDNSLQAGAKNIHIVGIQDRGENHRRLKEVLIYDDGQGMDDVTAKICLQLGGGSHINAKKNLGKFGMGLPQASGSQCMRTEVITWQSERRYVTTYLDYDELSKHDPPLLPDIKISKHLPVEVQKIINAVIKGGDFTEFSKSHGTIIYWKNCHQLNHKTYRAFYRNIEKFIGRVYRHYLDGKITISVTGMDRNGNNLQIIEDKSLKKIRVNDPMFLMKNNIIGQFNKDWANKATNEEYGKEIPYIEIKGKRYDVRIKFSTVKTEVRNSLGLDTEPGATPLGKLYGDNMGISLLRAGRELKIDNFGFIGDLTLPTNRWFSIEVEFQPELDDLFGVTFDKQEAKAFYKMSKDEYLFDLEETDDASLALMYKISVHITSNIISMRKKIKEQSAGRRTKKTKCPVCGEVSVINNKCTSIHKCIIVNCTKHTDQLLDKNRKCAICILTPEVDPQLCLLHNKPFINGQCEICEKDRAKKPVLNKEEEDRLRKYLEDNFSDYRGNKYLLDEAIKYFKNIGRNHFIVYVSLDANSFISYTKYGQITIISINRFHPFYERFMEEIITDAKRDLNELIPIHLLVGALINAELHDYENSLIHEDFRGHFSLNLKQLMKNYQFPTDK